MYMYTYVYYIYIYSSYAEDQKNESCHLPTERPDSKYPLPYKDHKMFFLFFSYNISGSTQQVFGFSLGSWRVEEGPGDL